MRLTFRVSTDMSVEFIKGILPLLGNVVEFQVYNDHADSPLALKGDPFPYQFGLRDEHGTEVWLDTNCGYGGTGPQATQEILHMLGLKDDFGIFTRKIVKGAALRPVHRLNVIACRHEDDLHLVPLLAVTTEYRYALTVNPQIIHRFIHRQRITTSRYVR